MGSETPESFMTAEAFFERYGDRDLELVRGRLVAREPSSPAHGSLDAALMARLHAFVRQHRLGRMYANTGFILLRNPDVLRGPDQAFVSAEREVLQPPPERGFWPLAPDLVVEIVSLHDTADELAEKVTDYLTAGVRVVWVIYPRRRQVHVFRPGADPRILHTADLLDGGEVLPGFRLELEELFA